MLMDYFDRYAQDYQPYKGGSWCYEDGCLYRGLECLHRATGEARWLDHIVRLTNPQILEGPQLLGYDPNEYNIDNIMAGRALLYLHEVTGRELYLETARLLVDQLATHPRVHAGVYWHKLRYPWQVWLDGLYMGAPFQIGFGQRTGDEALVEDALQQVETALELTRVPATGLYAHAMDEARKQPWCDPHTGHSRAHWARALGWLAMALVDVADLAKPEKFAPLRAQTEALLADIAQMRQPGGLWLQVIDQPDLKGNYEESSASAMFVYALLRASMLGLYDGDVDGLVETLTSRTVAPAAGGRLEMVEVCHVAGLGTYQNRFRDGSATYYLSEPRVADDVKGVGPLMMAVATEIVRARVPVAAAQ